MLCRLFQSSIFNLPNNSSLLHKHEIDRADNQEEGEDVIPMQILTLKEDVGDDGEDTETDALLYDLELNEIERTAIAIESHTVGRHLTAILKERYAP